MKYQGFIGRKLRGSGIELPYTEGVESACLISLWDSSLHSSNYVGSTDSVLFSGGLIEARAPKASNVDRPLFHLPRKEPSQPAPPDKITQEPIYSIRSSEKSRMSQLHITDSINHSFNNTDSFNNTNSFNNANSFNNVWNNFTVADEKSEIFAWLSPLKPQIRHYDIQSRRIDKVGDWLIQTEEYRNWIGGIGRGNSEGSALFGYGGPGVGKTFIR